MLLPFAMVRVVVQSVLRRRDEDVYVDERKQDHEETANGRRVSEKAEDEREERVELLTRRSAIGDVVFLERVFVVDGVFDLGASASARFSQSSSVASSSRSFFTSLTSFLIKYFPI